MKMASYCYSCILDRSLFEADLAGLAESEKKLAVEELLDYMACHKGGVSALVGTERERIIKRRSGNPDPYEGLKAESNSVAAGLLSLAGEFYAEKEDKIEALIRIAAAANSMEFGVKGHDFNNSSFASVFSATLRENLQGDLEEVKRRLRKFSNILYLTDNCGEVIFDIFVIEKLAGMGKRIVVGSKSEPILNDVTAQEMMALCKSKPQHLKAIEVIATGDVVGTALERLQPRALSILLDPNWLILAKGMGNFETISEYEDRLKGRLIYILRAKCQPVADEIGVIKGTLVARSI